MEGYRRNLTEHDLERMMIPRQFWQAKFKDIDTCNQLQISDEPPVTKSLSQLIETYLVNMEKMTQDGIGMFLYGSNGTGKTMAACVVAMESRRRANTVLFVETLELKEIVMGKTKFDDEQTVWERAKDVDFLLLDDIGKGVQDSKGFGDELIRTIVKHRASCKKVTWMTSQLNKKEFSDRFGPSMLSVVQECIVPVKVVGPDKRTASSKNLTAIFTQ